jgi:hypothetical protein
MVSKEENAKHIHFKQRVERIILKYIKLQYDYIPVMMVYQYQTLYICHLWYCKGSILRLSILGIS